MARDKKQVPAWIVGLLVAAVVFAIGLLLFSALGFGDDPVMESISAIIR